MLVELGSRFMSLFELPILLHEAPSPAQTGPTRSTPCLREWTKALIRVSPRARLLGSAGWSISTEGSRSDLSTCSRLTCTAKQSQTSQTLTIASSNLLQQFLTLTLQRSCSETWGIDLERECKLRSRMKILLDFTSSRWQRNNLNRL